MSAAGTEIVLAIDEAHAEDFGGLGALGATIIGELAVFPTDAVWSIGVGLRGVSFPHDVVVVFASDVLFALARLPDAASGEGGQDKSSDKKSV